MKASSSSGKTAFMEPNGTSGARHEMKKDEDIPKDISAIMKKYLSPKVKPFVPQHLPPPVPPPPPPPPPPILRPPPPDVPGAPPPPPPPVPKTKPYEMRVARMGNLQFKQTPIFSAIEVLHEEPRISVRNRQKDRPSHPLASPNPSVPEGEPIVKPNPKKIRIRSQELLRLLEEVGRKRGYNVTLVGFDIWAPLVGQTYQ